jgi:glucokinase
MSFNRYLVADIGGTSSRYAIFESPSNGELSLKASTWLKTGDFTQFQSQLERLKADAFVSNFSDFSAFVVAGAGPTKGDKYIKLTQVPWAVDLENLPKELKISRSIVLNDFAAQAYACLSPIREESDQILPGVVDPAGAIAVVGAGTGLGVAALVNDGKGRFKAISSEGSHVNYAPENDEEYEFLKFIKKELNVLYPSAEDTLSGRGLRLTHKFLTGADLEPVEVAKLLGSSPKTLELFARSYGRFCRNTALQYLSSGGLYIAGGIAAKNRELVTCPAFEKSFRGTRQHVEFISSIEVRLLDNQESGLWGAAQLATLLV